MSKKDDKDYLVRGKRREFILAFRDWENTLHVPPLYLLVFRLQISLMKMMQLMS